MLLNLILKKFDFSSYKQKLQSVHLHFKDVTGPLLSTFTSF